MVCSQSGILYCNENEWTIVMQQYARRLHTDCWLVKDQKEYVCNSIYEDQSQAN